MEIKSQKNKIKVGIVSFYYYPELSGPIIRFMRYDKYLKKKNIEFNYIVPYRGNKNKKNCFFINIKDKNSINNFFLNLFLFFKKKNQDLDVILFLNLSPILLFLLPFIKLLGKKIIFVNTMSSLSKNSFLKNILKKIIFNFFDKIVVSTKYLKKELLDLKLFSKKIEIIYNGVDFKKYNCELSEKKIFKKKMNLGRSLTFLFVGNLIHRKGIVELLQNWKKFKNKTNNKDQLIIIGQKKTIKEINPEIDGNLKYHKELDTFLNKKIKKKFNIKFLNFKKDITNYFKSSDVFCFPSRLEGTPNVLLEAYASKCLVMMNKFKGFSTELGDNNKNFVLFKVDENFSKLFFKISKNMNKYSKKIENTYFSMKKIQNIDITIERYEKLFRNLSCN